ncbi:MAG: hypothetical protein KIS66_11540 [Fimbriimonadaceae bacterium]|nr:hypothetical protein [Fimbriimonadaceae bacterium]
MLLRTRARQGDGTSATLPRRKRFIEGRRISHNIAAHTPRASGRATNLNAPFLATVFEILSRVPPFYGGYTGRVSPRLLLSLVPVVLLALPTGRQDLKPFAQIAHPPIDETSGMVKSRRYHDVYWVHNDSGDVARVFALRPDGSLIVPEYLRKDFRADHEKSDLAPYAGIAIEGASNID